MTDTRAFERKTFGAGSNIFREGDPGDAAYLIEYGAVEIYKSGAGGSAVTLAVLGKGDLFGEMALIDDSPRMATATAMNDTTVAVIPRKMFKERLDKMDRIMSRVLHILVSRTRSVAEEFVEKKRQSGGRERWQL